MGPLGQSRVISSSRSPLSTLPLSPHPELCVQTAESAGWLGLRQGGTFVKPGGQVKPRVEGGVGLEQGRDWFLHRPGTLIWSHSSILSFEGTLFSGALF